jgi:hypothetical protein
MYTRHGNFSTYTTFDDPGSDFAHIYRIIVTSATLSVRVNKGRILPSLRKAPIVEEDISLFELRENQFCEFGLIY